MYNLQLCERTEFYSGEGEGGLCPIFNKGNWTWSLSHCCSLTAEFSIQFKDIGRENVMAAVALACRGLLVLDKEKKKKTKCSVWVIHYLSLILPI